AHGRGDAGEPERLVPGTRADFQEPRGRAGAGHRDEIADVLAVVLVDIDLVVVRDERAGHEEAPSKKRRMTPTISSMFTPLAWWWMGRQSPRACRLSETGRLSGGSVRSFG